MSYSKEIGINAPTQEERFIQRRKNLVDVLATGGDYLIKVSEDVLAQMRGRGIDIQSSFFISIWPSINSGVEAFPRQYKRGYQFERQYANCFPWVSAGLTLKRITGFASDDINQATFLLGRYPVIKVIGQEIGSDPKEIEAEYPWVVTSPNRKVLQLAWDARYGAKDYKRHGQLKPFEMVFNQKESPGLQHYEETVLEPKKWSTTDKKLLGWLAQSVADAAVLTLTKDVSWGPDDISVPEHKRLRLQPVTPSLTVDIFQKFVNRAKQEKQAQTGSDVVGLLKSA
jgi:hypothetical protein